MESTYESTKYVLCMFPGTGQTETDSQVLEVKETINITPHIRK